MWISSVAQTRRHPLEDCENAYSSLCAWWLFVCERLLVQGGTGVGPRTCNAHMGGRRERVVVDIRYYCCAGVCVHTG